MTSLDARRLVFTYGPSSGAASTGIDLVDRRPLQKRTPPTDEADLGEVAGPYVEVHASDGTVRYRRRLFGPIRVHGEHWATSLATVGLALTEVPSGRFNVVVPDVADASNVALYLSPHDAPEPMWPQLGLDDESGTTLVGSWPWEAAYV